MNIKQGATKNFTFSIYRQDGTGPILNTPSDIVFTAVKDNRCCSKIITKKLGAGIAFDAETGLYTLEFAPEDTINLPAGNYPFDIKIKRDNAQYFIASRGNLVIEKSYTGII